MFLCGDLYCILGYHNNVVELALQIKITFHAYHFLLCLLCRKLCSREAGDTLVEVQPKNQVACFTIFPYVLNSFGVTAL